MAGISFSPYTGFPDPFLRKQTKFRQKYSEYSILDKITSIFFFLFDFLLTGAESLKASKSILFAYTVLLHLKLFALLTNVDISLNGNAVPG